MGISKDLHMELKFAKIKVYFIFSEDNQQQLPIFAYFNLTFWGEDFKAPSSSDLMHFRHT